MKTLKIGKTLELPLDAVTQKFAFLGRTGSGKTYGAKRMVEQMLRAGAQVVIIDPVGVWAGLRLGPKSLDVPVLGGLYGDIPLEPTAGALVADLIVDHVTSMVLDVSQMTDAERTRFATAFGGRFFQRKKASPSAVMLVIEECQELIPQNHQAGEERMLHEFQRIAKLGRNFGIGLTLISQRPQEVSKKALNQTECVFAFQLTGPHERKALEYWLSDKGFNAKLSEVLPRLDVGAPYVWSPQWLKFSEVVQILPIDTLDTSSTPKVGEKAFEQKKLKPIDLKALSAAMADTVDRAKADDPKALRARIAELERGQPPAPPPVLVAGRDAIFWHREHEEQRLELSEGRRRLAAVLSIVEAPYPELGPSFEQSHPQWAKEPAPKASPRPKPTPELGDAMVVVRDNAKAAAAPNGARPLELAVLAAIAKLQHRGLSVTRERVALMARYHQKSKSLVNAIGAVRGRGWLIAGGLELTAEGSAAVHEFTPLPKNKDDLRVSFGLLLREVERKILAAAARNEQALSRDELAAAVDYHPKAKSFVNALGRLRSLDLLDGYDLTPELR